MSTDATSLSYLNSQCKQLKPFEISSRLLTTCKNTELEISKCASVEVLRSGERHLNAAMIVLRSLTIPPLDQFARDQHPVQILKSN